MTHFLGKPLHICFTSNLKFTIIIFRTREAKRKRRSKADQERYFEDFPDDDLSIKNFNYVRKPLGLGNAAYELIRQAKLQTACKF